MAQNPVPSRIETEIREYKLNLDTNSGSDLNNTRQIYYRYINHEVDSAIKFARLSLEISKQEDNQAYIAYSNADLSNAYSRLGKFDQAFEHILRSIEYAENTDSAVYAYSMFYLAQAYNELYLYEIALDHFKTARRYFDRDRNKWLADYEILNIRLKRQDTTDLKNTLNELELAIPEYGNTYNKQYLYHYLALSLLFTESGEYERAMDILDRIERGVIEYGSNYYLGLMYYNRALSYSLRNNTKDAIRLGEKALSYFYQQGENQWITRTLFLLSNACRSAGDIEKAYDNLFEFEQRNRSIIEARQLATGSQFLSATSEKDLTESRLIETEQLLQQRQKFLLIVLYLFLSVVVVLIFAYRSNLEKKKALQRLDAMNKDKDRFMGIVSHDLRSPLNSIMMLSDIMTGSYKELKDDEIEEYAALILHSSKRMEYLIHNLLDANRIETGSTNIKLRSIDLDHTVKKVYQSMKILGEEKGIQTTLQMDNVLPKVVAEPNAVVRILENLLTNAYKFSEEGSCVAINLTSTNGQIELAVKDQGPGISASDQKKLFKKYTKLSAKPTSDEKSTGLGLFIVKNLVEEMNGEIHVESEPGKGTSFRVVLHTA